MIVPQTPYHVEYEPRKVDKKLKFFKRLGTKLTYIGEDFLKYLADIVFMRSEIFSYKTANFTKRNYHKIAHTLEHVWDELKKVGRGFKMLNEDLKFALRL